MLWAYEPLAFNGQGRAAIAIGNPDEAEDIAVVVPGAGSSVAGGWLSSGHNAAINLYDRSAAAQPDVDTSVIAWMGYDAPDGFNDQRIGAPWLAREGGLRLAHDVNGLWVTHAGATPPHLTVIGHSYGATTVADASPAAVCARATRFFWVVRGRIWPAGPPTSTSTGARCMSVRRRRIR